MNNYKFIDIHYHANPDLYQRRWSALKAGEIYQAAQGAVFLTSHLGSTCVQATLAQELGLAVFPSLILNHCTGGISPRVILHALNEYQPIIPSKLLVHFPTITGRSFPSKLSRQLSRPELSQFAQQGETLFNDQKQLRKEVIDILKMTNDYPILLTTGHAIQEEIYSLIDACIRYHVNALLINQPAHPLTHLTVDALKEIAQNDFVWIEQTALTYLLGHQSKDDFIEVLTEVPKLIYSSDLGQTTQMDVKEWFEYSTHFFAEIGLSEQRQEELLCKNAKELLRINV